MIYLPEAVAGLMKKCNLTPQDITKAACYGPDARSHGNMIKALGLDPKTQVQDPLFGQLGNTGTPFAMMLLVAAMEEAKAGDKLLLASYGDGADAFYLVVNDKIGKIPNKRGIKGHLAVKMLIPSYERYLALSGLIYHEPPRRPEDTSSVTVLWRDRNWVIRFHGSKCKQCGYIQYPIARICVKCQAKDDYEEVRLSDKKASLFTYSTDSLNPTADAPQMYAVVNFEGGGRIYTSITDRDPKEIQVGMAVEMTFRKFHEGEALHNYFWRAKPVR